MNLFTISSILASTFCLSLAVAALAAKGKSKEAIPFGISSALIGCWSSFPFLMYLAADPASKLTVARCLYTAAAFVPLSFWYMYFFVMGLHEKRDIWVLRYMFVFSFPLIWLTWSPSYIQGVICSGPAYFVVPGPAYIIFVAHFLAMGCYGLFRMMAKYRDRRVNEKTKNKYKYLFLSFGTALCGALIHFSSAYTRKEPLSHDLFIIAFVGILAYAILAHRLMDINIIIRKTLIYAMLMGALASIYIGIITLSARLFAGLAGSPTVFSSAVLAVVITLFFQPLRKRIQSFIDRKFFRQYVDREEKLYELSREVITHTTPEAMGAALMQVIEGALHPKGGALYLRAPDRSGFVRMSEQGHARLPERMDEENSLAIYFRVHPQPFVQDMASETGQSYSTRLKEDREDAA